ncbi:hypothetical protein CF335_g8573 [Tilletia laevis]|nr:hypothetical protein CF335_g8573 [Tilletia laevis]
MLRNTALAPSSPPTAKRQTEDARPTGAPRIQLCIRQLQVTTIAQNLIAERAQLGRTPATSITDVERQAFAAEEAQLEARQAKARRIE